MRTRLDVALWKRNSGDVRHCCIILVVLFACGAPAPETGGSPGIGLVDFIESHRKGDGGYGPPGQDRSEERWTWWAVRSLEILDRKPADGGGLAGWLKAQPPTDSVGRMLCRVQTARALNVDIPVGFVGDIPAAPGPWFPWEGSSPLGDLAVAVQLKNLVGQVSDGDTLARHVTSWRSSDGGWGFPVPLSRCIEAARIGAAGGKVDIPGDHPSSMSSSVAAVSILRSLGHNPGRVEDLSMWVESLRGDDDGYRATAQSSSSDLHATHDALGILSFLQIQPRQVDNLGQWIGSLRDGQGGYSHATGESPSLEATWLALDALRLMGRSATPGKPAAAQPPVPALQEGLTLWQAAVEMGGPAGVAVELAERSGIDLILSKAGEDEHLARSINRIAKSRGIRLSAAVGREEYGSAWGTPGVGYVTHCSDVVFPPGLPVGRRGGYSDFDGILDAWRQPRREGMLVLSCSFRNRELLAPAYGRAARGGEGYDLLMGAWAFATDGDVVRDHPWLQRYEGQVPFFGNHDAHGDDCFHWMARGLRTRTLFFARTGDLVGFREAVAAGRVVAVAHHGENVAIHGHPTWVEKARQSRDQWDRGRPRTTDWWLPAPLVIPVDQDSATELPYHAGGLAVLVRAAERPWDDSFPGEVQLKVDGRDVPLAMAPVTVDRIPALWAPLPGLLPGDHVVEVTAFGRTTSRTLGFGQSVEAPSGTDYTALVPTELRFRSLAEVPFIRVRPMPPVTPGRMELSSNRIDFVLRSPVGAGTVLVLEHGGGSALESYRVHVNGSVVGSLKPGAVSTSTFDVSGVAKAGEVNWVSIRTNLPGWTPRVTPSPGMSLARVALQTKKKK